MVLEPTGNRASKATPSEYRRRHYRDCKFCGVKFPGHPHKINQSPLVSHHRSVGA